MREIRKGQKLIYIYIYIYIFFFFLIVQTKCTDPSKINEIYSSHNWFISTNETARV